MDTVTPAGIEPSNLTLKGSYPIHLDQGAKVGRGGLEPPLFLMSQIYSLLPSPLGHATGASLLSSVTVRCVPCPIHLSPQTVSLHKLMGDGSGSWSCRESNSDLACCQPLLAVTCVGLSPLAWGRSSVDGCVRRTRTACRRCSCTGRANPSSDCPTSPIQSFPALTR